MTHLRSGWEHLLLLLLPLCHFLSSVYCEIIVFILNGSASEYPFSESHNLNSVNYIKAHIFYIKCCQSSGSFDWMKSQAGFLSC